MKSENRESFIRSHLIAYYTRLEKVGTMVVMKLENQPAHTSKDIFDRFAPIERGFVRTEIPMRDVSAGKSGGTFTGKKDSASAG